MAYLQYEKDLSPGITKHMLAEGLYSGLTYDTALPQSWIEAFRESLGLKDAFDVIWRFVWVYPEGNLMGRPMPLTLDAVELLAQFALLLYMHSDDHLEQRKLTD